MGQNINTLKVVVNSSGKEEIISKKNLSFAKFDYLFTQFQEKFVWGQNEEHVNMLQKKIKRINETITVDAVAINLQIMGELIEVEECRNNLQSLETKYFSKKSSSQPVKKMKSSFTDQVPSTQSDANSNKILLRMISSRRHETPSTADDMAETGCVDNLNTRTAIAVPVRARTMRKLGVHVKKVSRN